MVLQSNSPVEGSAPDAKSKSRYQLRAPDGPTRCSLPGSKLPRPGKDAKGRKRNANDRRRHHRPRRTPRLRRTHRRPAMKLAYADPPYLGCCRLYEHFHPDGLCWDDHRRAHRAMRPLVPAPDRRSTGRTGGPGMMHASASLTGGDDPAALTLWPDVRVASLGSVAIPHLQADDRALWPAFAWKHRSRPTTVRWRPEQEPPAASQGRRADHAEGLPGRASGMTLRNGTAYRRPSSVPPMYADESSWWPTPKASAANYGRPRANDRGDLQAAVLMWPTPVADDTGHRKAAYSQARHSPRRPVAGESL